MLFAAFLGYNPIQQLLGPVLGTLPPDQATFLTGRSFFPQLITGPFADGITAAFTFAVIACVVAAVASWFAGGKARDARAAEHGLVGGELAAVAGEAGGPSELVVDEFESRPGLAGAGELVGHLSTGGGPDGIVTITDREGRQIARTTASGGEYAVRGLAPGIYTATVVSRAHTATDGSFRMAGGGPRRALTGVPRPGGVSITDISRMFGVSRQRVSTLVQDPPVPPV